MEVEPLRCFEFTHEIKGQSPSIPDGQIMPPTAVCAIAKAC